MITRMNSILYVLFLVATSASAEPIDIGSRRELFVDRYLVDTLANATLQLHRPECAGIAIGRDKPWEGLYSLYYGTVLKDGDVYRMYYRACPDGKDAAGADGTDQELTCYAESSDGVHWVKPELGIFEVLGTKKNNVVLAKMSPYTHNFAPFLDTRPGTPASERYKAIAGLDTDGLSLFVSPDGIHWKLLQEHVLRVKAPALDSQNVAFWSATENCYLCYFRVIEGGFRAIARTTSPDLIHWSAPVPMKYGDAGTKSSEHLYINQTHPYFRAPHIYIATPARFMNLRRALSDAQAKEIGVADGWLRNDCSDTVLMSTRGGDRYDRSFMEAWVRPGIGPENWVSRSNYSTQGIVPTGPAEMSVYVHRHNAQESGYVARYVLRTDGFVSVHAGYGGGEMTTKPFRFDGKQLEVNYSTSAAGGIRVEIQDAAGKPIPGFEMGVSQELVGDEIQRVVAWKGGSDVGKLAGKTVRLRFLIKDADLYAIRFQ